MVTSIGPAKQRLRKWLNAATFALPLFSSLAIACALATSPDARAATKYCAHAQPAAGESYAAYSARAKRRDCVKPWTILVYMAADNDLAPYAWWDLHEMEAGYLSARNAAASTKRADLVVQAILPGEERSHRLHMFESPEPYDDSMTVDDFKRSKLSDLRSPIAKSVARDRNSGDDLESFLAWGIREYPAEHYMVVVWGHGQGWAPARAAKAGGQGTAARALKSREFSDRRFGGLAFTDGGSFLDIPTLHGVLRSVEQEYLGGDRIDVYASDACLMQMVEVAYEIDDAARFIIGSTQVEAFLGLPYRRMMYEINTNRFASERDKAGVRGTALESDEPYLLARMLPRLFRSSLEIRGLHGRALPEAIKTVTMSSISSDELERALVPSLKRLALALSSYIDEDPTRVIGLQQALIDSPSFMGGSQELGAFLASIDHSVRDETGAQAPTRSTEKLLDAIDRTHQALSRTVIAYALGTRYTGAEKDLYLMGFRAAAMWLPVSPEDFQARIRDFSSSLFYRALEGDWETWLRKLYAE